MYGRTSVSIFYESMDVTDKHLLQRRINLVAVAHERKQPEAIPTHPIPALLQTGPGLGSV